MSSQPQLYLADSKFRFQHVLNIGSKLEDVKVKAKKLIKTYQERETSNLRVEFGGIKYKGVVALARLVYEYQTTNTECYIAIIEDAYTNKLQALSTFGISFGNPIWDYNIKEIYDFNSILSDLRKQAEKDQEEGKPLEKGFVKLINETSLFVYKLTVEEHKHNLFETVENWVSGKSDSPFPDCEPDLIPQRYKQLLHFDPEEHLKRFDSFFYFSDEKGKTSRYPVAISNLQTHQNGISNMKDDLNDKVAKLDVLHQFRKRQESLEIWDPVYTLYTMLFFKRFICQSKPVKLNVEGHGDAQSFLNRGREYVRVPDNMKVNTSPFGYLSISRDNEYLCSQQLPRGSKLPYSNADNSVWEYAKYYFISHYTTEVFHNFSFTEIEGAYICLESQKLFTTLKSMVFLDNLLLENDNFEIKSAHTANDLISRIKSRLWMCEQIDVTFLNCNGIKKTRDEYYKDEYIIYIANYEKVVLNWVFKNNKFGKNIFENDVRQLFQNAKVANRIKITQEDVDHVITCHKYNIKSPSIMQKIQERYYDYDSIMTIVAAIALQRTLGIDCQEINKVFNKKDDTHLVLDVVISYRMVKDKFDKVFNMQRLQDIIFGDKSSTYDLIVNRLLNPDASKELREEEKEKEEAFYKEFGYSFTTFDFQVDDVYRVILKALEQNNTIATIQPILGGGKASWNMSWTAICLAIVVASSFAQ